MKTTLFSFLHRNLFFSWWRFRIGKLGVGWRSAAWSKRCFMHRFRYQRDPVHVWRAWGCWIQWGRSK